MTENISQAVLQAEASNPPSLECERADFKFCKCLQNDDCIEPINFNFETEVKYEKELKHK